MKKEKQIQALPFPLYYLTIVAITIGGLLNSIYLSISHFRVYTDLAYVSFCSISKSINCDTVSQSSYSIFLGLPVAVWGIIGYLFLLMILSYTYNKKPGRKELLTIIFLIALCFSLYSLFLAFVSIFYIHSYCLMCILSYGINFSLLFFSWIIIKRFNSGTFLEDFLFDVYSIKKKKTILPVIIIFIISVGIINFTFNDYWNYKLQDNLADISTGITEDGQPWIGSDNPELTIFEYSDYLCFQCKKMHFNLRSLVSKNKDRIRLVHLHYPIDKEFNFIIKEDLHPGAGQLAILAIYAGYKGKFWEMNDSLYQIDHSKGSIGLKDISGKNDININELRWALSSKDIRLKLKRDIAFGIKAGVTGTPSYVINGKTYQGAIPSEILEKYIN